MRRSRLVGLLAAATAACTLVTDLDGLAGPPLEAGRPDADGAPPDVADARADTKDAPGDAPPPFCENELATSGAQLLFCEDFDEGSLLTTDWVPFVTEGGATPVLDRTQSVSPPNSLFAHVDRGDPACTYAVVTNTLGQNFSRIRVSFSVRVGDVGSIPSDLVSYAVVGFAQQACQLIFEGSDQGGRLDEQQIFADGGGADRMHNFARLPRVGEWTRFTFDVDRTTGAFDVKIGGETAFVSPQMLDTGCLGSGPLRVGFGLYCATTTLASQATRYDDISVIALP